MFQIVPSIGKTEHINQLYIYTSFTWLKQQEQFVMEATLVLSLVNCL